MIHQVPYAGDWVVLDDHALEEMRAGGHGEFVDAYYARVQLAKMNPLAVFMPHGTPWHEDEVSVADGALVTPPSLYAAELQNDGVAFLSDRHSDCGIAVGPNQCGKTSVLVAWTALRILPSDPSWPVFTENGVTYEEWEGPKVWCVASYSWSSVGTIWERIREFFPANELGDFVVGGKKDLAFGDGKPKHLPLVCGSRIRFLCYDQRQQHWEGFTSDGASFDEQVPREKFIGWTRSTQTRGDYTPFGMALTGHVIDDRPDTGCAGWIYKDLVKGGNQMGLTVSQFQLSMDSTPRAVVSPLKLKKWYDLWVNPDMKRSDKDRRAAIARYWGGWETGSGMRFGGDVWDREIHVVEPFWKDDETPADLTKWRSIDYGAAKGINAVGWYAVGPLKVLLEKKPELLARVDEAYHSEVFFVMYRLLYERGLEIPDVVDRVIKMSGNVRKLVSSGYDETYEMTYKQYEEVPTREIFWGGTLLDPRSAGQRQQGEKLDVLFSRYGLRGVRPASGEHDRVQMPKLTDLMRIDWTRPHPFRKEKDGSPSLGMSRFVVFDGRCGAFVDELESARMPDDKQAVTAYFHRNDKLHAIDQAKYWGSDKPVYRGDVGEWNEVEDVVEAAGSVTPFTAA